MKQIAHFTRLSDFSLFKQYQTLYKNVFRHFIIFCVTLALKTKVDNCNYNFVLTGIDKSRDVNSGPIFEGIGSMS